MSPLFFFLPILLCYLVFRAVSHYRAKRTQFFLLTVFISCIIAYEIALQTYRYFTSGG